MVTFLEQIRESKLRELAREAEPMSELMARARRQPAPLDFAAALRGDGVSLIAEVKKASPSKGVLCPDLDPVALARTYAGNGAAAISVLTEAAFFQGSLGSLRGIKQALPEGPPLLRKDFLLSHYHVYQARAYGADAVLLIVALLEPAVLQELLGLSQELGMAALVEVHTAEEMDVAFKAGATVIGINNRDLHTFKTDIETTRRLRPLAPSGCLVVSESGIQGREDVKKVGGWGVNAVLVGEALVTAPDVPARVRDLASAQSGGKPPHSKGQAR